MRSFRSLRGFVPGLLLGLLLGSAGVAGAGIYYKGWQRFSNDFKTGYVTGFLDMARLARNLDPDGWVNKKYPDSGKAAFVEWANMLDVLYKKPENQEYSVASLLQLAAAELQKKYPPPPDAPDPEQQKTVEAIHRLQEKARQIDAKSGKAPDAAAAPVPDAKYEGEAKPIPPKTAKRTEPKFCRCDDCVPRRPKFRSKDGEGQPEGAKPAGQAPAAATAPATK